CAIFGKPLFRSFSALARCHSGVASALASPGSSGTSSVNIGRLLEESARGQAERAGNALRTYWGQKTPRLASILAESWPIGRRMPEKESPGARPGLQGDQVEHLEGEKSLGRPTIIQKRESRNQKKI